MATALGPPARSTARRWARRAFYAGLATSAVLLLWRSIADASLRAWSVGFALSQPLSGVLYALWPALVNRHWPWIVALGPALNWSLLAGGAGAVRDVTLSWSPPRVRPIHRYVRYWVAWLPGLYAIVIPALFAAAATRAAFLAAAYTAQACVAVLVLLLLGRAASEADPRLLHSAWHAIGIGLLITLAIGFVTFRQLGGVAEYAYVAVFQWLVLFSAIPAQLLVGALILGLWKLPAPVRPPPRLWPSLALAGVVAVAFVAFLFAIGAAPRLGP